MPDLLTTRELATALGVSESSVKRWADEGALRASRTAGGHRRITRPDAIRFVRETGAAVVRPQLLGLPDVGDAAADASGGDDASRLFGYLEQGDGVLARGLLLQRYLEGQSVATLVDGPLRAALERIGTLWHDRPDGVFSEHRATSECLFALHQLRLLIPKPAGAPVAVGGAWAGDPYRLPSLAAATVLAGEGFDAVDLGADTPADAFERAVERLAPRLVWISVSVAPQPERAAREILAIAARLAPGGIQLSVGGRAAAAMRLPAASGLHVGNSMGELAALARGLLAA